MSTPSLRLAVLLALAPLLAAPSSGSAGALCVKPGGGDGCFATIGEALAAAAAGDVIRVAMGDYLENLVIDQNVTLEGGWNADFSARDPAAFESRILPTEVPPSTESVVSIQGDFADPASSTPTFDGFTVLGGNADQGGNHGGGMRIRDSNALVRDNVVTGNRAFLFGGGIWVQRGAPRLEGNRVEDNAVTDGGIGAGISLENTQAVLADNVVSGNQFVDPGGLGAGVGIAGGGPVTVRGGRIEENFGNVLRGGGLYATDTTALEIDGVRFEANEANAFGDAVALSMTSARIANSSFARNETSPYSIFLPMGSPTTIANCTLRGLGSRTAIGNGSPLTLVNSIVTNWMVGVASDVPITATTNDFFGNGSDGVSLDATNLAVDPLLDDTHHLMPGSPLVDAGSHTDGPFHDFDREPRPMAALSPRFRFDIGADEVPGAPQRVVDLERAEADLTIRGPGNPPENPNSNGSNDWIGYSVLASDVSGDEKADLLISAQDWAEDFDTLNATGRLFGFRHFGVRRTGVIDLAMTPPDFQVVSRLENQHVGEDLAAGDVNGDGTLDLVAGSAQNDMDPDPVPTAFGLFGGADLATSGATIEMGALGDLAVTATEKNSLSFATENGLAAGDVSGDGVDDLAVGDRLADDGGSADTGAVFVVFGGSGLAGVRDLAATPADFTLYGPAAQSESFGAGPFAGGLALGDLDGDGRLDLVARGAESAHVLFGPLAAGEHHLATTPADVTVNGLEDGGVLVMDATGDRAPDLLLDSGGDLRVIPGPLAPGETLDAEAASAFTLVRANPRALAAGDLLGDLRPELLLGDPVARKVRAVPPGPYGPGAVAVDDVAALLVTGPFPSVRNLGHDVAAGDLDGDGRADLVAGGWQIADPTLPDMEFQDIGKAFVVYGETCAECACPAEPVAGCIAAGKGRLKIDERKVGNEKLTLGLSKLAAAVGPGQLGDPVGGDTRFDACVYGIGGALVGALSVNRAGAACGAKPCWTAIRAGFKYADPAGSADGIEKLVAKGGAAGKGKLAAKGRNDARAGEASLPTGLAAALAAGGGATVQVASEGACFDLAATKVKRAQPTLFDASAP
jgi:hypothetical protein